MKPELGDSEDIFLLRINVNVVSGTGKRRRLDESANRRGIVALDLALIGRAKALDLIVVSWELSATAPHVNRVAPDEFFFPRIFQVLPTRHPCNCGVSDVVRSGRLTQKLGQVSIARSPIQVIA